MKKIFKNFIFRVIKTKKGRAFLLAGFFSVACSYALAGIVPDSAPVYEGFNVTGIEPIHKGDRILVIAPHPDDETISCAGILQYALRMGAQVQVVYLTNGDNNQFAFMVYEKRLTFRKGEFIHMGQVRKKEAINAMKLLGIDRRNLIFLGYPDFGTFSIFRYFWQGVKPYKSMFTRVNSVPYKDELSYGNPYIGQSILQDFEYILTSYRPTKIIVSHPLDVNSDHKTAYLFLEIALADLSSHLPRPKIYTYLIHWKGWPLPRHYHPELPLLPAQDLRDSCLQWYKYDLSEQELGRKHKAVLCYKSQTQSSAFYLFAFARKNELLGSFPEINLVPGNSAVPASVSRCVNYELAGGRLLIKIAKGKNFGNKLNTLIYLFGHSYKTPFERMPKIRIVTRSKKFKIFDGKKRLDYKEGIVSISDSEAIISVPLVLLGGPDFLLASVKKYNKEPCVDGLGFRKVNLRRN